LSFVVRGKEIPGVRMKRNLAGRKPPHAVPVLP
jgi:hypothetical protein